MPAPQLEPVLRAGDGWWRWSGASRWYEIICEEPSISESVQASYSSRSVLLAYSAKLWRGRPVAVPGRIR